MTATEAGITERIARFVVETTYESLPPELITAVKRAWIDTSSPRLVSTRASHDAISPLCRAISSSSVSRYASAPSCSRNWGRRKTRPTT